MIDKYNADKVSFASKMRRLEETTGIRLDELEEAFEGMGIK